MIITLLVVSLLCTAFPPTRLIGVAGMALLFYLYPPLLVGFLVLGAVGMYFIHHK
jgi:hypothetical protein